MLLPFLVYVSSLGNLSFVAQPLQLVQQRVPEGFPVPRTDEVQETVGRLEALVAGVRRVVVPIADDGEAGGRQFHAEPQALERDQVQVDDLVRAGQPLGHPQVPHVLPHVVDHRLGLLPPLLRVQHPVVVVPHRAADAIPPGHG